MLRIKKMLAVEATYSLRYKQGSRISTTGCGMRKTDQDMHVCNYSVLTSITLTHGISLYPSCFSWMNSYGLQCELAARN